MPDRRIALCGASGTGKSTLAAWISETYGLAVNPVGSRSVASAMGFRSPYDVDAAGARAEFQRMLLSEKTAWEREHDSFVVDRTTFDNLAYSAMHDVRGSIDEEILRSATEGMRRYTHVFMCPIGAFQDTNGDPDRVKEHAYHVVYEAVLVGLIHLLLPAAERPVVLTVPDQEVRRRRIALHLEGEAGSRMRGFASMDPKRRAEIASRGGRAAHAQGTAHRFTPEEAREAGRKGGTAAQRSRLGR